MLIDYEPALVEAAVLAGVGAGRDAFHRERDPLYAIADGEAREAAFVELHARWFQRLGLDRWLPDALAERPQIAALCGRWVVMRARAPGGEAADLLVAPPRPPTVLVRCTPERLAAPAAALAFLRHELLHVADMLDRDFGYEPRLPYEGGRRPAGRLAERYRVLWDAYVDGRLVAGARAPASVRAERLYQFRAAFPELGDRAEAAFRRFFDARRRTHAELVAFATSGDEPAGPEASVPVN
jgi:hypothetical protein